MNPIRRLVALRETDTAEDGVSLVEAIVALVVFGLVAVAGAAMILTGIHVSRNTRERSQASTIANSAIETIRNQASEKCAWQNPLPSPLPANCHATAPVIPPAVTTTSKTIGSQTYKIKQTTEFEAKATPQTACNASTQGGASGVQPVLLVTESVSWPAMGGLRPVKSQTILTPPVGTFSDNTGAIDVAVLDGSNQPNVGIPVTVVGPSGTSNYTTDDNGCVLAAYLTPGTYSVTVSASGYVDGQESATSVQTLGVTTGTVTGGTFYYDHAAALGAAFVPASSWPTTATFQYPSGLPITVANSGLAGNGTYQLPNGTTGSAVFPYSSGYSIWAGRCAEANPDAVTPGSSPLYPTPPSGNPPAPTSVATQANQSTTASVPLYPLQIAVTDAASRPVSFTITEEPGGAKVPCSGPFGTYTLPGTVAAGPVTSSTYIAGVPLGVFKVVASDGVNSRTVDGLNVTPNGATATVAL